MIRNDDAVSELFDKKQWQSWPLSERCQRTKKSPQNVICILNKKIDITVEYEIRPRTMLFTVYLSFFCEGTVQNIGLDGGVKSTLFNSYSMYFFLFELLYFVHTQKVPKYCKF